MILNSSRRKYSKSSRVNKLPSYPRNCSLSFAVRLAIPHLLMFIYHSLIILVLPVLLYSVSSRPLQTQLGRVHKYII
ncbi:hypothetical protein EYC80_000987 [Monilinia laxa]|uniref:Uncharacterized protein n=1 Tax=Monilinia laxa TaxID=61186 RepID=A0A5N6K7Q2_MONLA|nr:hypothetical protein EYC80_000987 [Monilinia laxa]